MMKFNFKLVLQVLYVFNLLCVGLPSYTMIFIEFVTVEEVFSECDFMIASMILFISSITLLWLSVFDGD